MTQAIINRQHHMFLALTFLMRDGSVRSGVELCKIFYQLEQSSPSFRYQSGSGDGLGRDQVKSALDGLAKEARA